MTIAKLLQIVRDENPAADVVVNYKVASYSYDKDKINRRFYLVIINNGNYKDWVSSDAKSVKELHIQYLAWKLVREKTNVQLVHVTRYNPAVHQLRDSDPLNTVQIGDRVVVVEVQGRRQIVVPIVE